MKLFVFPGNIEEDILAIGAKQLPYMRTDFFSQIVKESEAMLLKLIGCPNGRAIIYTGSGTGAMDAIVTNYVSTKKKVLVIAGGSFGYRWRDLCTYYNTPYILYEIEFGKDIDYLDLEATIAREKPDVLLCQHHETSSGQLFNMKKIGDLCRENKVSLVVDAISSFLADSFKMDEYGVDICVTSSQKGLNILPGLAIIALAPKLLNYDFAQRGFYFDFKENLKNLTRGQTPYSPATSLFLQMHERLIRVTSLGVDQVIGQVAQKATFFRQLCAKYKWPHLAETPSNCITGFFLYKNGDLLFKKLMEKGFTIMPGGTPNYFRVSHLGVQSNQDLEALAQAIYSIEQLKP